MNDLGLNSLANIHVVGQFGNNLTPLIWLTVTATLMYVGPATVSLIYLLFIDHPAVDSAMTPMDVSEDIKKDESDQLKAA